MQQLKSFAPFMFRLAKRIPSCPTSLKIAARALSGPSKTQPTINMPTPASKSWERGAKLVKKTDVSNQYLEHIRETHDPALHLKTLEDELRGTMGKALGKQGEKIFAALRQMKEERKKYDSLRSKADACTEEIRRCAVQYNEYREKAMKARWELLVHRQAVGFIVDNHNVVHKSFPIDDRLPVITEGSDETSEEISSKSAGESSQSKKAFGTQLDWWQRIGRWR